MFCCKSQINHQRLNQSVSLVQTPLQQTGLPFKPAVISTSSSPSQPKLKLQWISPSCPQRTRAEALIRANYQLHFQAEPEILMPWLVDLQLQSDKASQRFLFGLTPASSQPLFLEQYLNQPIEQFLGDCDRQKIIEIGNLVTNGRGRSLIALSGRLLDQLGFEWVVMTATSQLANSFKKIGIPMQQLANASLKDLPKQQQQKWGNYYNSNPVVLAGHLPSYRDKLQRLTGRLDFSSLLDGLLPFDLSESENAGENSCL
ncbi:thermostable hemolysin [Pelagibaculum spongiae]|uniref:Thermostable hemolysin n=1 Tax=Pelagibaculum spongiae TaxID=2080658 RepID=A0A2V1GQC3_9GAMM|nr:thermostable hemolysin [Pelagibaculum spongiae]PVZ65398.1 hypothetical protein DC094_18115 [Pelagibaculum spongiae]